MSLRGKRREVGRALAMFLIVGLNLVGMPADPVARAEVIVEQPLVLCNFFTYQIAVSATRIDNFDWNRVETIAWKPYLYNVDTGTWYLDWPWRISQQGPDTYPLDWDFVQNTRFGYPPGRYWVGYWIWWGWDGQWQETTSTWAYPDRYLLTNGQGLFPNDDPAFRGCNTITHSVDVEFSSGNNANSRPLLAGMSLPNVPSRSRIRGSEPRASRIGQASPATRCEGKRVTLVGTKRDDELRGSNDRDIISGLGGDDLIFGGRGNDVICAGQGNDVVVAEDGADNVLGQAGEDILWGGTGRDHLGGGAQNDWIDGMEGDDDLTGGGQPVDILMFRYATQAQADFRTGTATGQGIDSFSGFAGVLGSPGPDELVGTSGMELFIPWGGDDFVDGGAGVSDAVYYVYSPAGVRVDLPLGLASGEGEDTLVGVESVVGSPYADFILGSPAGNFLLGLSGDDSLEGNGGNDTLDGGVDQDTCLEGYLYLYCENQASDYVFPAPPTSAGP